MKGDPLSDEKEYIIKVAKNRSGRTGVFMASANLKITSRTQTGTAACRRLRAQNIVPAVIYGHGEETLAISIPEHELSAVHQSEHHLHATRQ